MPIGPGKLDNWCTQIREATGALGIIVITVGTAKEQCGMSCQVDARAIIPLVQMLRDVANQIEHNRGDA